MTIKLNPTKVLATIAAGSCVVAWTMLQSFVSTVYATERVTAQHENKLVGIEAMRPQLQEVMIKVDSIEKAIRDMRDLKCNFKRKQTGE